MSTTSASTTAPSTAPNASTTANPPTPSAPTTTPSIAPNPPTTTPSTTPSTLRTSLPAAQARLADLSVELKYAKTAFATCCDAMRGAVVEELERELEQAVEEIGEVMMERVLRAKVVDDMRSAFEETRVGWAVREMREG